MDVEKQLDRLYTSVSEVKSVVAVINVTLAVFVSEDVAAPVAPRAENEDAQAWRRFSAAGLAYTVLSSAYGRNTVHF